MPAHTFTDYYVDVVDGSDANVGDINNPWQTLGHAFSTVGAIQGARRLNLSNKQQFVISASLGNQGFQGTADKPLIFQPWDNAAPGTGLTMDTVDGRTIPMFQIRASSVNELLGTSSNNRYICFKGGKLADFSTRAVYVQIDMSFIDCIFDNCSSGSSAALRGIGREAFILRCQFLNDGGNGIRDVLGQIHNCYFEGSAIDGLYCRKDQVVTNCVFKNCGYAGTAGNPYGGIGLFNNDNVRVKNNTFIDNTGLAGRRGFRGFSTSYNTLCTGNLFVGYDHADSYPVDLNGYFSQLGYNAFYTAGNAYNSTAGVILDDTSNDVTLASDPLPNGGSAPYELDPDSDAFQALAGEQTGTANISIGAHQLVDDGGGGGGGGGGTTDTNGPLAWNDGVSA
jgi:hypothetical protein